MLIGYARVSTQDQTLDLQMDALKQAGCEKLFTDMISGGKSDRPGLQEAMNHLRAGDTFVVWRLDRLGRTLKHLIATITDLNDKGIGFKSLQENMDTTTSGGKLIFHIFGALAEFEREVIRERTNAGLQAARARGRLGGGYGWCKERDVNKILLNDTVRIDLSTLIDTRLLVQANSGGGKSWLLRRLLEQSHGKVQQIVIDLEGEFSTLREKYDYILAAKEGDTAAEPRSAALLARRLLELNVSAIIDLYELSHQERKRFVRLFLSAMVNAPKTLWHPCLVIVDEAHVFAPQTGQSEAMEAVIDLATRGRKRGYCAVLATQRLSKLHKDAVAEMNNKLIGRTGLDIDRKRAAEELGFTTKEDAISLRNLAPGEFYAFGPAISEVVEKVTVGSVATSHPKAGARIITQVTPPTAKIRSIIAKLTDLPQEAREEAQNYETLKTENTNLKRRLIQVEKQPHPVAAPKVVTIEKPNESHLKALRLIQSITAKELGTGDVQSDKQPVATIPTDKKPIVGGALRMLQVLASRYPMTFTKSQLALLANLSPKSGTYGTYLSLLRSQGLIEVGGEISITDEGLTYIGTDKPRPQSQEEVLDMWRNNLTGGARRMFDALVEIYPGQIDKAELGERTEMSSNSGTFGTYLSLLRRNGLVEVTDTYVKANSNLFVASTIRTA